MREVNYLSPTSIQAWIEDRETFYLNYLAENRPPRTLQTQPMSIGSAFDAYVKAALYKELKIGKDPTYSFEALFETQVEEHNRDWARVHGKHAFDSYVKLGAYESILEALAASEIVPRFESTVQAKVDGIDFLGKPDVIYQRDGHLIILDWKVNGYCSKYPCTPYPGYTLIRGGRNSGQAHKDAQIVEKGGIRINTARYLEESNLGWARQLSIYAWVLGAEVGSEFVVGIDQLACKANGEFSEIRVAEHRAHVSAKFQHEILKAAKEIHEAIAKDHIFNDFSPAEDKKRRSALDKLYLVHESASAADKLFAQMTR